MVAVPCEGSRLLLVVNSLTDVRLRVYKGPDYIAAPLANRYSCRYSGQTAVILPNSVMIVCRYIG